MCCITFVQVPASRLADAPIARRVDNLRSHGHPLPALHLETDEGRTSEEWTAEPPTLRV